MLKTRKLFYFGTYFEEEFSNARFSGRVRFSGKVNGSVILAPALLDVVKSNVAGIDAARAGVRLWAARQNGIWDTFISAAEDDVPLAAAVKLCETLRLCC